MLVRFYEYVEGEKKTYSHFFHGCTQTLLHETNLDDTYGHSSKKFMKILIPISKLIVNNLFQFKQHVAMNNYQQPFT